MFEHSVALGAGKYSDLLPVLCRLFLSTPTVTYFHRTNQRGLSDTDGRFVTQRQQLK